MPKRLLVVDGVAAITLGKIIQIVCGLHTLRTKARGSFCNVGVLARLLLQFVSLLWIEFIHQMFCCGEIAPSGLSNTKL